MRILKILAATLAAFVGLLIIAAVLLVSLFDPNDYKDRFTAMVEARTGRELTIGDDIELSLFPWFAIETGGITIGNAEGFGEQPFATIDEVSARVRVWPLLKRQVEIGTVTIDGIVLNLGTDAQGVTNWSDLLGPGQPAGDEADAAETPAASTPQIERLAIEGIRIRGGRILWREAGADVSYLVSDLSLETGEINDTDPVDVELAFSVLDVASQNRADIQATATASLVPAPALGDVALTLGLFDSRQRERAAGRLELASATLTEAGSIALGMANMSGTLTGLAGPESVDYALAWRTAGFDPAAERLDVAGLTARLGGLALALELSGQGPADDYRLTGTATVTGAEAAELLDLAGLSPPAGLSPDQLGRVDAAANFDVALASRAVALENVRASLLGLTASGNAGLDADGVFRARIAVPPVTPNDGLRAVLAAYLPDGVAVGAISRLGFASAIARNADGSLQLDDTVLTLGRGTISGQVALAAEGGRMSGRLRTADVEPDLIAALLPALLPENVGPDEIGTLAVDTAFVYEPRNDRLNLDPLSLRAFGLSGEGSLMVTKLSTAASVTGQAEIAAFPPKAFLTRFGQPVPQTSDPNAFRSARVAASFELDADHGDFRDIVVDLDDSRITGGLRIDNFSDPSYRFTLRADTVDVDRYLPPPAEDAAADERAAGDIALRTEPLEKLRLEGTASVGNLKLAGLAFQQVTTELDFGDGLARLDSARANLYGGHFDGRMAVDTTGETPSMSLTGKAENLALEPFLTALLGESSLSGTGNFDLDLTGTGRTVTENLQSAAGTMGFALTNGSIAGFNLERTLCAVFNRQAGLPGPAAAPARTDYSFIRAMADVSEGIATSRELTAESPALRITGSGRLTLADQRVDYDMRATQTKSIAIANCESMDRHIGSSFPFTIRGPLSGPPEVLPDFGQYLRDRVRDEIQDRVREGLQERLRNLL